MIRLKVKGVKSLRRYDWAPFKDRLLQLYYKHLHQLVTEYIYKRISEGRLGRSRWERYAYYRGWVLGRYGSDRARKKGVPKIPAHFPGVERIRAQLLAQRIERYATSRRIRKEIVQLAQQVARYKNRYHQGRVVQPMLEDQSSPLVKWMATSKVGQRVYKYVERRVLRVQRLLTIDQVRGRKDLRRRLQHWMNPKSRGTKDVPTKVRRGWKFAVQTGQLAMAWKHADSLLDIKKGTLSIIPKESADLIKTRMGKKSLSLILSRTLKQSGQPGTFISPSIFGKLSRQAMERAINELGVKLK